MLKIALSFLLIINFLEALETPQLFNKQLIKVKKEDLVIYKSFYGTTRLDESSFVDIVSRFDGYITKLHANKNYMKISKNQTLFSIYSEDILAIQNELQISKNFNKNIYQSSLLKLENLGVSQNEINKIKNNQVNKEGIDVKSPVNGILIEKNINQSSFVNKGAKLFQLASLDKLWFVASVYQEDLSFVKDGVESKIKIDGVEKTIQSKVDFIYPILDEKTKTVSVRFIIQNNSLKLLPSMFGKVFIGEKKGEVLTLPKTAVLKKAEQYYVFKPTSDKDFLPVKVVAKRVSSNKYEIIDGLNQGDEVINNALFLMDSEAVVNSLYEEDKEDW